MTAQIKEKQRNKATNMRRIIAFTLLDVLPVDCDVSVSIGTGLLMPEPEGVS